MTCDECEARLRGLYQAELRRRREQLIKDMAEAKATGNFVRYRALKERWDRFHRGRPPEPPGPLGDPPSAA